MTGDYELDPRTHARTWDPTTSHDAAVRLSSKRTMMRRLLWVYLLLGPLTAEEATEAAGYEPDDGAWKRCSDLASRGWITDTGTTRTASTGREQMVREITLAGRRALR